MKAFILSLVILCAAAAAGTMLYLHRQQTPSAPAPAPVVDSPPEQPRPEPMAAPKQEPPRIVSDGANSSDKPAPAAPVASDAQPPSTEHLSAPSQAVDALLSPQTSVERRKELLQELKSSGQLDQAIAELKQRAADNPNDPAIPTTLGVAYLSKFPVQDPQEASILGLEADQSFNTALKIDPANWPAQFMKAQAMSYWPPELNKGDEIVQRFSSLIEQQDTMPSQPLFAQTYVLLGDEYQKLGQSDYAEQTWKLGAAKFPTDPALQKRLSPH
jgi:tetratricopeptide (TPR) repeat protein